MYVSVCVCVYASVCVCVSVCQYNVQLSIYDLTQSNCSSSLNEE